MPSIENIYHDRNSFYETEPKRLVTDHEYQTDRDGLTGVCTYVTKSHGMKALPETCGRDEDEHEN